MRLKVFSGRTVQDAMAALRRALGDGAVILATEEGPDGVRVTAGIEAPADPLDEILRAPTALEVVERLALALGFHLAGGRRIERLCLTARDSGAGDPVDALAYALAEHLTFRPLARRLDRPLVITGGPGVGKTLMVARLAAAARLAGCRVHVASTDVERTAGTAQLAGLVGVMGIELEDAASLAARPVATAPDAANGAVVLVDTASVNPLRTETLAAAAALARRLGGELLPVLPADLMPAEAHDQAAAWRALGAGRFLASRLDAARRLGMLLAAADAGLGLAGVGVSPLVAEPVKVLTAANLARLLLHRARAFAPESRP
jgi:flagellar biosynthesis protein FlhF